MRVEQPIHDRATALAGVLQGRLGENFSPSELLGDLQREPVWIDYLGQYASERAKAAAVGHFLLELGVLKSERHRSRGSLYHRQAALTHLHGWLESCECEDEPPSNEERAQVRDPTPGGRGGDGGLRRGDAQRNQELVAAVRSHVGQNFSPSEILPQLLASPRWTDALEAYASGRGQAAAVGRYLQRLGLQRARHDRGRGSIYDCAAVLQSLAEARLPAWRERGSEGSAAPAAAPAQPEETWFRSEPRIPSVAAPVDERVESPASTAFWPGSAGDENRDPLRAGVPPRPSPEPVARPAVAAVPEPVRPGVNAASGAVVPSGWGPMQFAPAGYMAGNPGDLGMHGGGGGGTVDSSLPLGFYWTQIRRHQLKIIVFVVLATLLAALLTARIPKQYEAVAVLRVDPSGNQPVGGGNVQSEGYDDIDSLIATEQTEVHSRAVAQEAVRSAHLAANPVLNPPAKTTGGAAAQLNPQQVNDALIGAVQGAVSGVRPANTRNIEIHARSTDPATAATLANAVAEAMIAHEFRTRLDALTSSSTWMTKQLEDLRIAMESSAQKLQAYQRSKGIFNPDAKEGLDDQRLGLLNSELTQVQATRFKDQADQAMVQSGGTDAILASDRGATLRPAYDNLRQAQAAFSAVAAHDGPANPVYQNAQRQVQLAQQQLDSARKSLQQEIAVDYRRSRNQEALVSGEIERSKASLAAFNSSTIDYNVLKHDADQNQKLYEDLQQRIKEANLSASFHGQGLRLTDRAVPSAVPVYPDMRNTVTLTFLFSLLGACALAIVSGQLDRSFTSPERVEQILGIPFLGALPTADSKASMTELAEISSVATGETESEQRLSRSPFAEAVLTLRTAILFSSPGRLRTLSITSAQPLEGKSSVTSNLAVALATHGAKVLLIDADIRRPTVHRAFEVSNRVGLSTALRGLSPMADCIVPSTVGNLYLLPAGPAVPSPAELLSTSLSDALEPLKAEFDHILLDCPPLLGFVDALTVATLVDGVVLVTRAGETPRERVLAAVQQLRRVRANILGLVLNAVNTTLSPYYDYYRAHYERYYGQQDPQIGDGE